MKLCELVETLDLKVVTWGDRNCEISGMVVGDMLSFVMAQGQPGWGWITIQSHVNVAAVAVLREMPLIIIASDRPLDDELVSRCASEGITLAVSPLSAYGLSGRLYGLGVSEGS